MDNSDIISAYLEERTKERDGVDVGRVFGALATALLRSPYTVAKSVVDPMVEGIKALPELMNRRPGTMTDEEYAKKIMSLLLNVGAVGGTIPGKEVGGTVLGIGRSEAMYSWSKGVHFLKRKELRKNKNNLLSKSVGDKNLASLGKLGREGLIAIGKSTQKELDRVKAIIPYSEDTSQVGFYRYAVKETGEGPSIELNIFRTDPELGIAGTLKHEQTHARQFDPKLEREERPFADLMRTEEKYQESLFRVQDQEEVNALLRGEKVSHPLTKRDFYRRYDPHEAMARGVEKSPKTFNEAYQEEMEFFLSVLSEHRSLREKMGYMINWEKVLGKKRRGE